MGVARLDDDKPESDMRKQRERGVRMENGRSTGWRVVSSGAALVLLGILHACGGGSQPQSAERVGEVMADTGTVRSRDTTVATGQTPLPPGSSVDMGRPPLMAATRVLFIGTSLTAGFGLADASEAWPGQVGHIADSLGYRIEVLNAGLSGETSAGALRRTDWLLRDTAQVVVIETGANDGLRGMSVEDLYANLRGIVLKVRAKLPVAEIIVVQMEAPPNMGAEYATGFRGVYPAVAKSTGVTLMPFLLDGVAGVSSLNQADGIHPTREGAAKAARNAWPTIRAALDRVKPRAAAL
jgi:acyl-CoA thioesterase I